MASQHIQLVGLEKAKEDFESSFNTFIKEIGVIPEIKDKDFSNLNANRGSTFSLTQAFDVSLNLCQQLMKLKWRFLFSNAELKYITSDNPIYYYSDDDQDTLQESVISENVELTIPLSKQVALVAMKSKIEEGFTDSKPSSIRAINKRTVWGAKFNIYTSFEDKTFMKFVDKNKNIKPYMAMASKTSN